MFICLNTSCKGNVNIEIGKERLHFPYTISKIGGASEKSKQALSFLSACTIFATAYEKCFIYTANGKNW